MPYADWPLRTVIAAVCGYWICVAVMTARSRVRFRAAAGALPRTARERLLWGVWVPNIAAWIALPILAATSTHWLLTLPPLATESGPIVALRGAAALLAVAALLATIPCWLSMGSSWSMAVVPGKKTDLLTGGMFAFCRNPIYTFNMTLALATAFVTLTIPMGVVALLHVMLVNQKVQSEERYLADVHGEEFHAYCRRTGRFVPWQLAPSKRAPDVEPSAPRRAA